MTRTSLWVFRDSGWGTKMVSKASCREIEVESWAFIEGNPRTEEDFRACQAPIAANGKRVVRRRGKPCEK